MRCRLAHFRLICGPENIQERSMTQKDADNTNEKAPQPPVDVISQSSHTVHLNDGASLSYTATAGRIILKSEDEKEGEKPKAAIFFVAYTLDRPDGLTEREHAATRPITFSFN